MTKNRRGASGSGHLTQAQLNRAAKELLTHAGARGLTESEAAAALQELSSIAAAAQLWEAWESGDLRVARRDSTGELAFLLARGDLAL